MPRRQLSDVEIAEARLVFGSALDYTRAYVFENARWTNWIDQAGAVVQRRKRGLNEHNAVTLGNTSYFPIAINTEAETIANGNLRDIGWLIHELTHQWQFQRFGWRYLAGAVSVQVVEGRHSYNYQREHDSRESALNAARKFGRKLRTFNMEQQGDIARDYYLAFKAGRDWSAWEPFIRELQEPS
jgi:hypothetical protein